MKHFVKISVLMAAFCLFTTACAPQNSARCDFFAMDTNCSIEIAPAEDSQALLEQAKELVINLEKMYSKTIPGSVVSRFSECENSCALTSAQCALFSEILSLCRQTGGAFDPTVASLMQLWGFGTEQECVPSAYAISHALQHTGYEKITLQNNLLCKEDPQIRIDLGGALKGYTVEALLLLLQNKTPYAMVNLGGNIGVCGSRTNGQPWKIGLRDPAQPDSIVGILSIESGIVAVSGAYERYFEQDSIRYHHILSPHTGYPAKTGIASVAVIAQDGLCADILSTALFVMGKEKAAALYQSSGEALAFETVLIMENGNIFCSEKIANAFSPIAGRTVLPLGSAFDNFEVGR